MKKHTPRRAITGAPGEWTPRVYRNGESRKSLFWDGQVDTVAELNETSRHGHHYTPRRAL